MSSQYTFTDKTCSWKNCTFVLLQNLTTNFTLQNLYAPTYCKDAYTYPIFIFLLPRFQIIHDIQQTNVHSVKPGVFVDKRWFQYKGSMYYHCNFKMHNFKTGSSSVNGSKNVANKLHFKAEHNKNWWLLQNYMYHHDSGNRVHAIWIRWSFTLIA